MAQTPKGVCEVLNNDQADNDASFRSSVRTYEHNKWKKNKKKQTGGVTGSYSVATNTTKLACGIDALAGCE